MRKPLLLSALLLVACGRAGLGGLLEVDEGSGGSGAGSSQGGSGAGSSQGGSGAGSSQGGSGIGGSGAGSSQGGFGEGGGPFADCGNGVIDPGELCDDGNAANDDACVAGCVPAACGDGFEQSGVESCDDGNVVPGDGCSASCVVESCGNGIVEPGESCDDANLDDTDACLSNCNLATCGDGFLRAGVEQCDDGNTLPGDGCSPTCTLPACGDGALDPGESCDAGAMNETRYALAYRQGSGPRVPVRPHQQPQSAVQFYNYFSTSAHTGFEAPSKSRAYFYRNTTNSVLSLIVHHGIDLETSGISTPQSFAQMAITGLPNNTFVGLTDDSFQEFNKPFNQPTVANGNWGFQDNTDGGVLAGFPLPGNWTVNIAATFSGAPIEWEFLDGTTNVLAPLDESIPLVLEARNQPSQCRLDCTVPTCGDGVFDAGEVCDDGNQVGGDGCAANCLSLAN